MKRRTVHTIILLSAVCSLLLTAGILFASNQAKQPDIDVPQERVSTQPTSVEEQIDLPPIEKDPPKYPNLDSNLNRLAGSSGGVHQQSDAQRRDTDQSEELVLVTFYVKPEHLDDLLQYLENNDIFVRNAGSDYVEAHVATSMLGTASERPGVLRVDTVVRPRSNQSRGRLISQGVDLHGADAWHNAGYRGNSIKVGIIDIGFEGFGRLQGRELPSTVIARCYFDGPRPPSSRLADCEVDSGHGTAVAEALFDVAPEAEFYIANIYSFGDVRNAADWMAEQGVKVINVSLGFTYDGPGNGTSPFSNSPLKTIDAAVTNDITWINAAGNTAQNTWYGTFRDPTNQGVHHWTSRDEGNTFTIKEGDEVRVFMRWDDDWGRADCDLDLALFKSQRGTDGRYPLVSWDFRVQNGSPGSYPYAVVWFEGPVTAAYAGVYFLAILEERCADKPDWIQLTSWIGDDLQYYSTSHHTGNPEESRNPGMMAAVGATHWWDTSTIASYSNRGPTIDGRTKPDITGISCGRSATISFNRSTGCWFRGTSQAAPHVAGLAALIRQRFPHYSATETVRYLEDNALDRGSAGADNTWGHGFASLPKVGPTPTPTPTSTRRPTFVDPTGNISVTDGINSGEVVISWDAVPEATYYRIGYVNMVKDYPLAKASNTGEWIEAFVYVDVNALNTPPTNGRSNYTLRRLVPGDRHAFTVLTSNDVENTAEFIEGRYGWPSNPRWQFHTPR